MPPFLTHRFHKVGAGAAVFRWGVAFNGVLVALCLVGVLVALCLDRGVGSAMFVACW